MKNNTGCELVGLEEESQIKLFLEKYYSNLWYFMSRKSGKISVVGKPYKIQQYNIDNCYFMLDFETIDKFTARREKNYLRKNRQTISGANIIDVTSYNSNVVVFATCDKLKSIPFVVADGFSVDVVVSGYLKFVSFTDGIFGEIQFAKMFMDPHHFEPQLVNHFWFKNETLYQVREQQLRQKYLSNIITGGELLFGGLTNIPLDIFQIIYDYIADGELLFGALTDIKKIDCVDSVFRKQKFPLWTFKMAAFVAWAMSSCSDKHYTCSSYHKYYIATY